MGKAAGVFGEEYLSGLIEAAKSNARRRQHSNVHTSYEEPCQKLFNALCSDSYIRPHRHQQAGTPEFLVAVRGLMGLVLFDSDGGWRDIVVFGTEAYRQLYSCAVGVEVRSSDWHTVVAVTEEAVLLEVKAGPFQSERAKEFAEWAPPENTPEAAVYWRDLQSTVVRSLNRR